MPTPDSCTWDLTPPRRPGLADLGGGQKIQSEDVPPDPVNDLTAPDVNQWAMQLAALGQVAAAAIVSIGFTSGYFIAQVTSPAQAVTDNTFEITHGATGAVTITWPAGTFPPAAALPTVSVNGTTPLMHCISPVTNGVLVKLASGSGPVDAPFTLTIH